VTLFDPRSTITRRIFDYIFGDDRRPIAQPTYDGPVDWFKYELDCCRRGCEPSFDYWMDLHFDEEGERHGRKES
jgi:hypothetical protein